MTVHWLDPLTRNRQHAVLACSRLKGRHTYDVLTEVLVDIHYKFNINEKVTRTTTDNGSNFVKAFVQSATEAATLPLPPPSTSSSDDEDQPEDRDDDDDPVDHDQDDLEAVEVDNILEEAIEGGSILPTHMRCAAHTFNLVATADAGKALDESSTFRSTYRKTLAKAQALWNQQSRSTVSADIIMDGLNRRLVVPNSTRWNSLYDSINVLNLLLSQNR